MKNQLKSVLIATSVAMALWACGSKKTSDKVSDSIDAVHDSVRNDTSSTYNLTSRSDSLEQEGNKADSLKNK